MKCASLLWIFKHTTCASNMTNNVCLVLLCSFVLFRRLWRLVSVLTYQLTQSLWLVYHRTRLSQHVCIMTFFIKQIRKRVKTHRKFKIHYPVQVFWCYYVKLASRKPVIALRIDWIQVLACWRLAIVTWQLLEVLNSCLMYPFDTAEKWEAWC